MRYFITFLVLITTVTCCRVLPRDNNTLRNGGGSFVLPIDQSKNVYIMRSAYSSGVVFPAEYTQKLFGHNESFKGCVFFTPDSALIKIVDQEISRQYCSANRRYWNMTLNGNKEDTSNTSISQLAIPVARIANKTCLKWQRDGRFYDRQYIAYFNKTGEKVVIIKLIDFRDDPHHLKRYLTKSWIDGWHGWFYSNIIELRLELSSNMLIITKNI